MKKYPFLFIAVISLILSSSVKAQTALPKSIANVGLGVGTNYGVFGVKTVIGYKNSGVLIGLGMYKGNACYEIGGQLSYESFFFNAGYGEAGIVDNGDGTVTIVNGFNLIIGGMPNLNKRKTIFIDVGLGFSRVSNEQYAPSSNIRAILGLGFRIGSA